jgi:hypothetical protein
MIDPSSKYKLSTANPVFIWNIYNEQTLQFRNTIMPDYLQETQRQEDYKKSFIARAKQQFQHNWTQSQKKALFYGLLKLLFKIGNCKMNYSKKRLGL